MLFFGLQNATLRCWKAETLHVHTNKKKKNRQYELYKEKHAIHVRNGRAKNQRNEELLARSAQKQLQEKRREATRKRVSKYRFCKREEIKDCQHPAPFNSASAFAKATARAKRMMKIALPTTPRRRQVICRKLLLSVMRYHQHHLQASAPLQCNWF